MRWSHLTWEELPDVLARGGALAILPVGATEQHGPHLGCGMDTALATRLCRDAAARTGVAVLPALPFGCSLGHSHRWPGTIMIEPETLIELVTQIGFSAHRSGVRRLLIVNAHVTNAAPLRCALEKLRAGRDDLMAAVLNTASISRRVREAHHADATDWHANDAETSLMLALDPEMVRPARLADADDPDRTEGLVFAHRVDQTSRNGVTGRPSRATVEKGEQLFGWLVDDLSALVERAKTETPPLDRTGVEGI